MHRLSQRALVLALLLAAPAAAAELDHGEQYRACTALVYRQPAEALESAAAWEAQGGGVPARHCAALVLFETGRLTEAAERLERLAAEVGPAGPVRPADLQAQAANVWLLLGEPARARPLIEAALRQAPDDPGLLIDSSRLLAAEGDYAGALAALDRALAAAPGDDDAHAFRASALRRLGRLEEALAAAERALALNRDNPSALLERGLIRLARGDRDGARLDLVATRTRFAGTPAAEAASAKLDELAGAGD